MTDKVQDVKNQVTDKVQDVKGTETEPTMPEGLDDEEQGLWQRLQDLDKPETTHNILRFGPPKLVSEASWLLYSERARITTCSISIITTVSSISISITV